MREEELLRHASASLARYKVPSRVFFLRGLPRNDAGKVNKKKLTGLLPDTLSGELANLEENQTMEHLNDHRAS